uniref:X8 domain-containing protein n=1 Tax=Oryza brachyantha TaxID=4533 RepID=J3MGM4_ORYBR
PPYKDVVGSSAPVADGVPPPPPPYCVYPPPPPPPPSPVVFPGPGTTTHPGVWCVANPTVASAVAQTAMDYACGSGADCDMLAPGAPCFLPDTLMAHASYAFNSYWQRTKVAGGTCDFAGAAMLITKDPSYDGCRYMYM